MNFVGRRAKRVKNNDGDMIEFVGKMATSIDKLVASVRTPTSSDASKRSEIEEIKADVKQTKQSIDSLRSLFIQSLNQ